jgi:hypothetical protein
MIGNRKITWMIVAAIQVMVAQVKVLVLTVEESYH